MGKVKSSLAQAKAQVLRQSGTLQGVGGAASATGGALILWGAGWALITLGSFLLLGAWGSK